MKELLKNYSEKEYSTPKPLAICIDFAKFGAKWQQNDCIRFINMLKDESFTGWSEDAINGYLTACITVEEKLKK